MKFAAIYPDWPLGNKINALTTVRVGGASQIPFDSFNLALHVGDERSHVMANRATLRQQLQLNQEPKWLQQIHSNTVVEASAITPDSAQADASYTTQAGIVCAVLTADCLPILVSDVDGSCVGVIHAGWRGLLAGVIQQTIKAMSAYAKPYYVWLGPAIGPTAFQVGSDVLEPLVAQDSSFERAFVSDGSGKWKLDIYQVAKIVLAAADISAVYGGNFCTYTDSERFFSYRRESTTGRMATLIWMN